MYSRRGARAVCESDMRVDRRDYVASRETERSASGTDVQTSGESVVEYYCKILDIGLRWPYLINLLFSRQTLRLCT